MYEVIATLSEHLKEDALSPSLGVINVFGRCLTDDISVPLMCVKSCHLVCFYCVCVGVYACVLLDEHTDRNDWQMCTPRHTVCVKITTILVHPKKKLEMHVVTFIQNCIIITPLFTVSEWFVAGVSYTKYQIFCRLPKINIDDIDIDA